MNKDTALRGTVWIPVAGYSAPALNSFMRNVLRTGDSPFLKGLTPELREDICGYLAEKLGSYQEAGSVLYTAFTLTWHRYVTENRIPDSGISEDFLTAFRDACLDSACAVLTGFCMERFKGSTARPVQFYFLTQQLMGAFRSYDILCMGYTDREQNVLAGKIHPWTLEDITDTLMKKAAADEAARQQGSPAAGKPVQLDELKVGEDGKWAE